MWKYLLLSLIRLANIFCTTMVLAQLILQVDAGLAKHKSAAVTVAGLMASSQDHVRVGDLISLSNAHVTCDNLISQIHIAVHLISQI